MWFLPRRRGPAPGSPRLYPPLNVDARNAHAAYLVVRPTMADDHLVINQRRGPHTSQGMQNLVAKYARRAGLEDVTPHSPRHRFGKDLLDAGVDLVTVAALLGHERLETTAMYTQPSAQDFEQAVGRLTREARDGRDVRRLWPRAAGVLIAGGVPVAVQYVARRRPGRDGRASFVSAAMGVVAGRTGLAKLLAPRLRIPPQERDVRRTDDGYEPGGCNHDTDQRVHHRGRRLDVGDRDAVQRIAG